MDILLPAVQTSVAVLFHPNCGRAEENTQVAPVSSGDAPILSWKLHPVP